MASLYAPTCPHRHDSRTMQPQWKRGSEGLRAMSRHHHAPLTSITMALGPPVLVVSRAWTKNVLSIK